jgi:dolichol-phosphate mannosyltransferase
MKEFDGRLFILERKGKLGLGTAYIAGFRWALEHTYEYIFEMDADFSHNPDDLIRLRDACVNGADLAVGSRYVKGGHITKWDYKRVVMSYFASLYVRMVLWINVHDTTAGFKCYRRRVLEAIHFDDIHFIGYAFQIEMKYRTYKKGFKIVEVPITFTDRVVGVSKMSGKIFKEAILGVIQMRFLKV